MPIRTVIGFGYEARSGKDTVTDHLLKLYAGSRIIKTSFARALRFEIHQEVQHIAAVYSCPIREAMQELCWRKNVRYDPFAKPEGIDIYGKQRELLQYWGMWKREISSTYWVDKVAEEINIANPDIVLISDLRFFSEGDWIKSIGGQTVNIHRPSKETLSEKAAEHISEHQLAHYAFDHKIINDGSLKQLHERAENLALNILQGNLF